MVGILSEHTPRLLPSKFILPNLILFLFYAVVETFSYVARAIHYESYQALFTKTVQLMTNIRVKIWTLISV
jgi:hypothetical protein